MTRHSILLYLALVSVIFGTILPSGAQHAYAQTNNGMYVNLIDIEGPASVRPDTTVGILFVVEYHLELGAKIRTRIFSIPSNIIMKELVHLVTTSSKRTDNFPSLLNVTGIVGSTQHFLGTVEYQRLSSQQWERGAKWQQGFSLFVNSTVQNKSGKNSGDLLSNPSVPIVLMVAASALLLISVFVFRRKQAPSSHP